MHRKYLSFSFFAISISFFHGLDSQQTLGLAAGRFIGWIPLETFETNRFSGLFKRRFVYFRLDVTSRGGHFFCFPKKGMEIRRRSIVKGKLKRLSFSYNFWDKESDPKSCEQFHNDTNATRIWNILGELGSRIAKPNLTLLRYFESVDLNLHKHIDLVISEHPLDVHCSVGNLVEFITFQLLWISFKQIHPYRNIQHRRSSI